MSAPFVFEEEMRKLQERYAKTRRRIMKSQEQMGKTTGAAQSKNRVVSAKVDARGELTELKLQTQAWRSMAPQELCSIIRSTINDARAAAQQRLWKSMGDLIPSGVDPSDVASGNYNWGQAMPEKPGLPKIVEEYLRDAGEVDGTDEATPAKPNRGEER
jgi:DNA-binding protein YbaB